MQDDDNKSRREENHDSKTREKEGKESREDGQENNYENLLVTVRVCFACFQILLLFCSITDMHA